MPSASGSEKIWPGSALNKRGEDWKSGSYPELNQQEMSAVISFFLWALLAKSGSHASEELTSGQSKLNKGPDFRKL